MGLIRCPECRGKVSTQATACPHCGCPGDQLRAAKRSRVGASGLVGCGLLLLGFYAIGQCANSVSKSSQPTTADARSTTPQAATEPVAEASQAPPPRPRVSAPSVSSDEIAAAIASSDDFGIYRQVFIDAAAALIHDGRCSLGQLRENGGWVRSQTHKPRLVYFVYCGAPHVSNRFYVDATTGQVFQ